VRPTDPAPPLCDVSASGVRPPLIGGRTGTHSTHRVRPSDWDALGRTGTHLVKRKAKSMNENEVHLLLSCAMTPMQPATRTTAAAAFAPKDPR
jgi:hypothetical protein